MRIRVPMLIGIVCIAVLAVAQQSPQQPVVVKNINGIKSWSQAPYSPTCARGAVRDGDTHGPSGSVTVIKFNKGCTVPMHWHSSTEKIVMVSGSGRFETQGAAPQTVNAGDYWAIPAHTFHQLTCTTDCAIYRFNDGPVDLHYVDQAGNEITPDKALAAFNERPSSAVAAQK